MESYDHVCFDLDGVLLDSEKYGPDGWIQRTFKNILRDLGAEESEENFENLYSDSLRKDIEGISERFNLNGPSELWSIREKHFLKEKLKALKSGEIKPYEDIKVIPEISQNYSLSIVSNSPQLIVEKFLEISQTEPFFKTVIGRGSKLEDFRKIKPHPYLLNKMLKKIEPDNPLYVGDRETDYLVSDQLDIDFCWMIREGDSYGKEPSVSSLNKLKEFLRELQVSGT